MASQHKLSTAREQMTNMAEVLRQNAQADALFDSIGDGAIATGQDGRIQRINKAALDMLGLDETEVIGKWFPKIFISVDEKDSQVSSLNRPITQAILTGKPVTERARYMTKSGRPLSVSITVSPIILNGRPIGAVEIFRDVTKDDEIDKMKSEFISIASHQLRTPLSAIKTYAHLLEGGYQGKLNNGQQKFMQIILNSIDRMNDLINILLDISRIEVGKIDIVLKETDIEQLAQNVIRELKPQADHKRITIDLECQKRAKFISLDRVLTTEVLANLLSNAIKYTPEQGRVQIKIKEKDKELICSITDNGYGIPAAEQDQIFTKFFRGDNIKQKDTAGTGLGLYMAKKIVETTGGKIWFKSKKDKGTTFSFTIPKNALPSPI